MPWNPDGTRKTSPLYMKGAFKMKTPYEKHEPGHVAGQYLTKTKGGYSDSDTGKSYTDPQGLVTSDNNGNVIDNDYVVNNKGVITSIYEYPADKKK